VGYRNYDKSFAITGSTDVMLGYRVDSAEGIGFALVDVLTGEVIHEYVTDPNYDNENYNVEGGGFKMTLDNTNRVLYSTLFCIEAFGQTYARIGRIDLTTNEYSDLVIEPFRRYHGIVFDPSSGNLYITAPDDDAIVVLSTG
jgi:hypothetical protein